MIPGSCIVTCLYTYSLQASMVFRRCLFCLLAGVMCVWLLPVCLLDFAWVCVTCLCVGLFVCLCVCLFVCLFV